MGFLSVLEEDRGLVQRILSAEYSSAERMKSAVAAVELTVIEQEGLDSLFVGIPSVGRSENCLREAG